MAGRVTKSVVDWARFAGRVRPENMSYFRAFKSINDKYITRIQQFPEALPKIDFAYYKKTVDDGAWVKKMQKLYSEIEATVPYPKDPQNCVTKIESDAKDAEKQTANKLADLQAFIACHQAMIDGIKSLPPLEEMTLQMYSYYFPDEALNPRDNPTFWPHISNEQPGTDHFERNMYNKKREYKYPIVVY